MSQFADSCRVSIYRLVAPPGDEEMEPVAAQPTLLELLADCDQCLDEMHQKSINESTMRKEVEAAFAEKDSKGLESLLASMLNRIRTHDAQLAAIVPALDPAPQRFRAFAFGFGRDILLRGDFLSTVTDQSVQQAFLASLPSDWGQNGERCPKKSIHHFFPRGS